jgi:hypothetical protein
VGLSPPSGKTPSDRGADLVFYFVVLPEGSRTCHDQVWPLLCSGRPTYVSWCYWILSLPKRKGKVTSPTRGESADPFPPYSVACSAPALQTSTNSAVPFSGATG